MIKPVFSELIGGASWFCSAFSCGASKSEGVEGRLDRSWEVVFVGFSAESFPDPTSFSTAPGPAKETAVNVPACGGLSSFASMVE